MNQFRSSGTSDAFVERQKSDHGPFAGLRVVLVAAHPDDEVLGAGGQFAGMAHLTRVFLTDGASSQREAWLRGWLSRRRYGAARLQEAHSAATVSGVAGEQICLGARDRAAALTMADQAVRLSAILRRCDPDCVLTHPYEGGHSDHDAAAFIARAACRKVSGVPLWEMTSYHAAEPVGSGASAESGSVMQVPITTGAFRLHHQPGETCVYLRPCALGTKRQMLACFTSQAKVLTELGMDPRVERFRPAPEYDFDEPPHSGALLYEQQGWARMTGVRWRSLAAAAAAELDG